MANSEKYGFKQFGALHSFDYRVFFVKDGVPISPVHDVPLWVDKSKGILNAFIEIPRATHAKLEVSKSETLNPIWQDTKNGKLRFIADKYPFPYNYGALPQTWENPNIVFPDTKAKGDNDPVDICEIGSKIHHTGELVQVKLLGGYAMIDEGETDWKVIVIDVNDENASKLNDVNDIDQVFPGKTAKIFEFLRDYKIPDGKKPAQFGYDSKLLDKAFMMKVIDDSHEEWKKLVTKKEKSTTAFALQSTTQQSSDALSKEQAQKFVLEKFNTYLTSKI